ncbi:MAG TPA: pyridoxamine 5'-phosphate oxidase family protein [Patescibacteria group bacterium]|nr:pyridoxamine 5'-phosphate oxidase family protein [Patescibacteria group bacterium]
MKDLSKRAKEIIEKIDYITIASVTPDGMPWNTPVYSAFDKDYNFFWGTHIDSQKAKNIRNDENVFLVIYDSTVPPGTGEGVFIQAKAHQLNGPYEIKHAYKTLIDRHPDSFWGQEAFSEEGPVRLFTAIPQKAWMNDDGEKNGHYIDVRTEIKL